MTKLACLDPYAKPSSLQIPEWYFYAVLPIMGVMMFIRTLIVMVEDWFDIDLCQPPSKDEAS